MKRFFNVHVRKSAANSSCYDLIQEIFNAPELEIQRKHSKKELEAQEAQKVEDQIENNIDDVENDPWLLEEKEKEEANIAANKDLINLEQEQFFWDQEDYLEEQEEILQRNNFDSDFNNGKIKHDAFNIESFQAISFKGKFNIMDIILESIQKERPEQEDDQSLLWFYGTATKGNFTRQLDGWSKIFGIKEKAVTNLLTILKQNIPDIQWPLRISNAGNYLNSIKSYCVEDTRILEFHICPAKGNLLYLYIY